QGQRRQQQRKKAEKRNGKQYPYSLLLVKYTTIGLRQKWGRTRILSLKRFAAQSSSGARAQGFLEHLQQILINLVETAGKLGKAHDRILILSLCESIIEAVSFGQQ